MSFLRPIRLGIYFDQIINTGGGYQQSLTAALLARQLPEDLAQIIFFARHKQNIAVLASLGLKVILVELSFISKVSLRLRRLIKYEPLLNFIRRVFGSNRFERHFIENKIDLVYFLSPSEEAVDLEELNYITTVWDLAYREDMEFPEVRVGRTFENREQLFGRILPKAVAILVDSELGKENVVNYFRVAPERVFIMPFFPALSIKDVENGMKANSLNIAKKYNLDFPYVYYPAQFWAHKNHAYILYGLKILEVEFGYKVGAVFSGGDKGNQGYIERLAQALELEDRVRFVGFVSNNEVPYLYKQSLALVMPTYFGPTNLPPYEAFSLGVPVLYSDKPGLKDQVDRAALMIDLNDPTSMAKSLTILIENPAASFDIVKRGHQVIKILESHNRLEVLETILLRFQSRMRAWN